MQYKCIKLKDCELSSSETEAIGTVDFKVDQKNILFGFSRFQLCYEKKDHHVRKLSLNLRFVSAIFNEENGTTEIKLAHCAEMYDDSGNSLDSGKVDISIVAYDPSGVGEGDYQKITALQGFSMSFSEDHHVLAYSATRYKTYICDASDNNGSGSSTFNDYDIPAEVLTKMNEEQCYICAGFTISEEKDDSHVRSTGLTINSDVNIYYNLSDKSSNHAYAGLCSCQYNTYEACVPNSFVGQIYELEDKTPVKYEINGYANVVDLAFSHVQGIVKSGSYYICSHNNKGYSKGHMIVMEQNEDDYCDNEIELEHYNHPGGIQAMGRYMIMGIEDSDHEKSYLYLYDINNLSFDNLPKRICDFTITRNNAGVTAAGICKDESRGKYIVAAYDMHKSDNNTNGSFFDFYEIDYKGNEELKDIHVDLANPSYSICKEFTDCQNISMYYDPMVKKNYVIAFTTTEYKASYADYMEVYELDIEHLRLTSVVKMHLETKHGDALGSIGVHFRWGASLNMVNHLGIMRPEVVACCRNFDAKDLTVNIFAVLY